MPKSSAPADASPVRQFAVVAGEPADDSGGAPEVTILPDQAIGPDGFPSTAEADGPSQSQNVIPLPDALPLGRFLIDVLTKCAWAAANPHYRFCGPALPPARASILERLGHLPGYMTVERPTRFSSVAQFAPSRFPSPAIAALAAPLRGKMPATGHRIAILPAHATEQFALANRASLAAWLRAKHFTLIDPEAMDFAALTDMMADARVAVVADPSQIGLTALCHAGVTIFEIAPDGWLSKAGSALGNLLGLTWIACPASPPTYKLSSPLPFGSRVPLSYEIPIGALAKRLSAI